MATKDLLEKGAVLQRDKETYAIAPHLPGGLVTSDTLRKIADVADKYNAQALKLTSSQRIAIVGLKEEDLDNVWNDLDMKPGAAIGLCVRSVKFCPGTTFCKRGQQDSVGVGMKLDNLYHGMNLPNKLKIGVSGCPNSCSENHFRDIGIMGTAKGFKIQVGGKGGIKPRIGDTLFENIDEEDLFPIIDKIVKVYAKNAKKHERLGSYIDRVGIEEFKKEVE
ncbi:nitrite/sulfite reductase domain-containing protein [Tepidibacter formicigenes]|jgi:NAD(P)H-nitrite reductase large subunit|uniref:Nitrite/Sulfite reductase ferredoxin-like half domain-containing protein n=1 Tax=Tepidibacter formicigenes DSM 15518 TaxID=1123349 RepID=A0A1M6MZ16_9FIRM|nr:NAD(P)/FAD-dependent oxidoreductase [Tepidibacter formicigenes]SHJ88737.1 Nitrite/Sulfite reductase ferredoxin-like half domain-containing protein [Tepidibacter formicigenes DSM 15518]